MKKFLFSLCFAAFLSAGLVSCADEATEVTPEYPGLANPYAESNDPAYKGPTKP